MFTKKTKTKKLLTFMAMTMMAVSSLPGLTLAFPNNSPRYSCDEGVHPFIKGVANTPDNNAISHKSVGECKSELAGSFPSQHKQPVNPDTHNPAKTDVSVNYFRHYHTYFNDSNQNDGLNNYYKSQIRKFEITLQPDFVANVDPNSITCSPPDDGVHAINNDFLDCNGSDNYTFGGTTVNRVGNVITYTFGTDHYDWGSGSTTGLPILPGYNPDIDQGVCFNGDTSLDSVETDGNGYPSVQNVPRGFMYHINAKTKDTVTDPAWSATTTSRVRLLDWYIPQSKFNAGKNHSCYEGGDYGVGGSKQGWCASENDFYWFNIGTDVTVWKNTTPPPPSAVCFALTVTADTTDYNPANKTLKANTPAGFHVEPSFTGNGTPPELDYKWEATGTQTAQVFQANLIAAAPGLGQSGLGNKTPIGNDPVFQQQPQVNDLFTQGVLS